MRSSLWRSAILALALSVGADAQSAAVQAFSVPGADAPELAPLGQWAVGVRTVDLVNPGQPDILKYDKQTGKAPLYDRPLRIEVWYPAAVPEAAPRVSYESPMPQGSGTFRFAGIAVRDAKPAAGRRFPLVIVSHGYPGSRTFLSYLTENLASKGYVVAAIDHTDSVFGQTRGFSTFPSALLNRAADQLFTLAALPKNDHLAASIDTERAAIIGYSMGGYGALASAGAGYSKGTGSARMLPSAYFEQWTAGDPRFEAARPKNLKAVVAIAPWGAQPPYRNWDAQSLAAIRTPLLIVAGDQDDISGYETGIKPAFEQAVNSERCMLVYENANHNVGGNPAPEMAARDFKMREFFDEPVWRKDRILAINQHFVTAFLDLYLKGDETKRGYLQLASVRSNDGKWPLKMGKSVGAGFSEGAKEPGHTYWKGFQRRWALGLQMHCAKPAQ